MRGLWRDGNSLFSMVCLAGRMLTILMPKNAIFPYNLVYPIAILQINCKIDREKRREHQELRPIKKV